MLTHNKQFFLECNDDFENNIQSGILKTLLTLYLYICIDIKSFVLHIGLLYLK
jgi:hypothetical protein